MNKKAILLDYIFKILLRHNQLQAVHCCSGVLPYLLHKFFTPYGNLNCI